MATVDVFVLFGTVEHFENTKFTYSILTLVSECVSKYLAAVFVVSCWMVCCWLLRALLLLRKEVDEKDRKNVAKKKKAEKMR